MIELMGWGRYPRRETDVVRLSNQTQTSDVLRELIDYVPRGNGRSYGDAAIGERCTLSSLGLNRMVAFDASTGLLVVEAGVLLGDIIQVFGPRGFFPSVVPGTKHVTVGGAIAADIHGKNHHLEGGFGNTVESIRIVLPSSEVVVASRTENPELFYATIGGMGLTGTILEATIRLRSVANGWIRQTTIVANDLYSAIDALESSAESTYSVAWIDSMAKGQNAGRALVYLGEHASNNEVAASKSRGYEKCPSASATRIHVPVDLPTITLNSMSVAAFNEVYFRNGARHAGSSRIVPWNPYFFPLDGVGSWNRIYGKRGFIQHQSVLPMQTASETIGEILDRVSKRGDASFLSVLKKLGPGSGLMSFPMAGLTLTLDFKMNDKLLPFLGELDSLVVNAGGRLYLAKDACQSQATFEAGYSALQEFRDFRRLIGADKIIKSKLSTRLGV